MVLFVKERRLREERERERDSRRIDTIVRPDIGATT